MNIVALPRLASVWRIAPPLTCSEAQIDEGITILDQAIRESL
jgi:2,2-dialkylglycine decarboxylase (pyruvate)